MLTFYLCLKIFFARLIDVSLGTIRTIFTVKDKHFIASIVGLIEVTVWFLIVQEALNNNNSSFFIVFSYAFGFSVGTYLGGILSSKFINSKLGVQVILSNNDNKILERIRKEGFAISVINIVSNEEKYMLYIQIDSRQYNKLISLIKRLDSKAFIVVNETKFVQNGYFKVGK